MRLAESAVTGSAAYDPAPLTLLEPRLKLRVGVFADSRMQPRALVDAFAEIAQSRFAEVAVGGLGRPEPHPLVGTLVWLDPVEKRRFGLGPAPSWLAGPTAHLPH